MASKRNKTEWAKQRNQQEYHNRLNEYDLMKQRIETQLKSDRLKPVNLTQLEDNLLRLSKKTRKTFRRLDEGSQQQILSDKVESIKQLLRDVRIRYVGLMNETHSMTLDELSIVNSMDSRVYYLRISQVVFSEMTAAIIPAMPQDEYLRARTLHRRFIIHSGDTNTGKTYHALEALKRSPSGIYLGPLRLLALEVFHKLNEEGLPCNLSTGEEEILVDGACHLSCTVEKLNSSLRYDMAVIDEAQMISDSQRGHAWTAAILGTYAKEIHVCCSPNAVKLITKLIDDCDDSYQVNEYVRDTPLVVEINKPFVFPQDVTKADALIAFSKRSVIAIAGELNAQGISTSLIYGDLPPEARRSQVKLFLNGETDVVVATDAIGMGLNLPIRRIVYMETQKFDGNGVRKLNISEIKQISGRAGRKNIYNIGYINAIDDKNWIEKLLNTKITNIETAGYLPAKEYLMSFPVGNLDERLFACMEVRKNNPDYRPTDITQQLFLLYILRQQKESIKHLQQLTMEQEYKLSFIPFDSNREELVELWIDYVKCYVLKKPLRYPIEQQTDLDSLELYYKQLSLYYSFAKAMGITIDFDRVTDDRSKVSEQIHSILRNGIREIIRRCRICGAQLEYDFRYNICNRCYYTGRR
ncbi:MAG: hypothetical protein FWG21_00745 [Oscillospiraceae bacterium]|nr:hypothetical protein [Oscillospiraceae bacterium]